MGRFPFHGEQPNGPPFPHHPEDIGGLPMPDMPQVIASMVDMPLDSRASHCISHFCCWLFLS